MQKEGNGQVCYPLHTVRLPEYFCKKAEQELNETPETREVELKKLKALLSADELTSYIEFEDDFLHQYLRHRKYDSSRAFQYLLKYLSFRKNHGDLFLSIPEEEFKDNPSSKGISVLPYRCHDGCAIVIIRLGKWNASELPFEYFKRQFMVAFLQSLRYPMTQINGFKIIYDFKDTLKNMRYCTPHNLFLIYNAALSCLPARYKEVHMINKNLVLSASWAVLKHAFSEKLRNRIHFHSDPEELLEYIPKSVLPTEYGGSLDSIYDEELMRKINKDQENYPLGGQPNQS